MIRRPPRSTRLTHSFPTRRSSDLRRRGKAIQRRPQRFLDFRRDDDMLMREQGADPFYRPRPFVGPVDSRKRLEGDGAAALVGMTAVFAAKAERVMCAAPRQHGSAS